MDEFKAYKEWCRKNGLKPCYATSLKKYMETLQKQGFSFYTKIWVYVPCLHSQLMQNLPGISTVISAPATVWSSACLVYSRAIDDAESAASQKKIFSSLVLT